MPISRLKILVERVVHTLFLMLALLLPQSIYAHHSQAHYSREFSRIDGELVEVKMRNPHVLFTLKTTDSSGEEGRLVNLETTSLYYLDRAGISRDNFKVGDKVSVMGRASNRDENEFLASEMILANGEHVFLLGDEVESRFSEDIVDTVAENKGVFRVWSIPRNNERKRHLVLTEAAEVARADWDPVNNYSTQCDPGGMPRLMWYPHPFELVDQGDKILARFEMYNVERTIHLDHDSAPEGTERTRWGYSTGFWADQNTLIVNTSHIGWNYYQGGIPMSDSAEVIEEFVISEDQSRLDLLVTTVDPENFLEPATVDAYWVAIGEELKDFVCELD